ncbi:MAG: hypothetical protein ABI899_05630 [Actinomycetota bacterium]
MSAAHSAATPTSRAGHGQGRGVLALRGLIALAMVVDAVVHIHLSPGYQLSAPSGVGAGNLFRLEAAVAIAAALLVLVRGNRTTYAVALLVASSALAAVLLYRYLNVPAIGPLPAMYEPVWFLEKSLSAAAEATGAIVAGAALLWTRHQGRPRTRAVADQ